MAGADLVRENYTAGWLAEKPNEQSVYGRAQAVFRIGLHECMGELGVLQGKVTRLPCLSSADGGIKLEATESSRR